MRRYLRRRLEIHFMSDGVFGIASVGNGPTCVGTMSEELPAVEGPTCVGTFVGTKDPRGQRLLVGGTIANFFAAVAAALAAMATTLSAVGVAAAAFAGWAAMLDCMFVTRTAGAAGGSASFLG